MSCGYDKNRPNPLRVRTSCPDCGFVVTKDEQMRGKAFDCPRCKAHWTWPDFWAEHDQKRQGQNHKIAKADLSGEADE